MILKLCQPKSVNTSKIMNLHQLSIRLTQKEGKKRQVDIAQTKEIIKRLGEIFNEIGLLQTLILVFKIRKNS